MFWCAFAELVRVVVGQVGGEIDVSIGTFVNILVEVRIQRHHLWTHPNHSIRVRCPIIAPMLRDDEMVEVSFQTHVLHRLGCGE